MGLHISTDCNGMICVGETPEPVRTVFMDNCQFLKRYASEGNREFVIRQLHEIVHTAPTGANLRVVFACDPTRVEHKSQARHELSMELRMIPAERRVEYVELVMQMSSLIEIMADFDKSKIVVTELKSLYVDTRVPQYHEVHRKL